MSRVLVFGTAAGLGHLFGSRRCVVADSTRREAAYGFVATRLLAVDGRDSLVAVCTGIALGTLVARRPHCCNMKEDRPAVLRRGPLDHLP